MLPTTENVTDDQENVTFVVPDLRGYFCTVNASQTPEGYCSPFWDQILCWPQTEAGSTAKMYCPLENVKLHAYRHCPVDGNWTTQKTDYGLCLKHLGQNIELWEMLRDVIFILSTISLVMLLVTIFIFQYFRSLQCSRITIHKHMVVSFILRFIVTIVMVEPHVFRRSSSYRDYDWLCKTVTAISQYTTLANMFWMLVEGFFLHHNLVLGVFSTDPPFKWFYCIGWVLPALLDRGRSCYIIFTMRPVVLPALFVGSWSIVLHYLHHETCWYDYSKLKYYNIIVVPFLCAIVLNILFLVNIIRVLVSKLRSNNRLESANIVKAIKATVVLMPLLGLTNVIFITTPVDEGGLKDAYHITNAILHSSQGIFVSVLYCFLNGEVRRVIRQKWYRFKLRHTKHGSGRRRSSRTSSFFLSGTEVHPLRALRNKMCPALTGHVFCENSSSDQGYDGCKTSKQNGDPRQQQPPETDMHMCTCTCAWNADSCKCCCSCCNTDVEDDI